MSTEPSIVDETLLQEGTSSPVDDNSLSHDEIMKITQKTITELLRDPVLRDIPQDVTASELTSLINLEKGAAFIVNLRRVVENDAGYEHVPLIVDQCTSVAELKRSVQREVGRRVREEGGTDCVSWKHVWRTYWLVHNNEKLNDDHKVMRDYGIRNGSEITFLKRLRRK